MKAPHLFLMLLFLLTTSAWAGGFTDRFAEDIQKLQADGPLSRRHANKEIVGPSIKLLLKSNQLSKLEAALASVSNHKLGVSFDDILTQLQGHAFDSENKNKLERLCWVVAQIGNTYTGEIADYKMLELGAILLTFLADPKMSYGVRVQAGLQLNLLGAYNGHEVLRTLAPAVDVLAHESHDKGEHYLASHLDAFSFLTATKSELLRMSEWLISNPDGEFIGNIKKAVWMLVRLERGGFRKGRYLSQSPFAQAIRSGQLGLKQYYEIYSERFKEVTSRYKSNGVPARSIEGEVQVQGENDFANKRAFSDLDAAELKALTLKDTLVRLEDSSRDLNGISKRISDFKLRTGFVRPNIEPSYLEFIDLKEFRRLRRIRK